MTSGQFHIVPLGDITVNRDERQRRDLSDIEILADSIRRLGLIHPIVVTRDLELVAGERRYAACTKLCWSTIPVQYVDELEPARLRAIELEENIKRQDISWQDQVMAIREYHRLRGSEESKWTHDDTAEAIGLARQYTSRLLAVGDEVIAGNKMVLEAPKLTTAIGITERLTERRDQRILDELHRSFGGPEAPKGTESIITGDFISWIQTETVPQRFNLIHCDFPYGIEADTFNQGAAPSHGGYTDTKEHWQRLMEALAIGTSHVFAPSCHLMFWFAMRKGDTRLYEPTVYALERMGWNINPLPLIWMKSDGIGIIPDPERGPRQIYETCLFGSRGDRKIVRAVANAYAAPTVRDKHMSEKPEPMLRHFFGMLVDENTVLLDPTCGSGSALRAAESLGAKFVLGVESNPEFADIARTALKRARALRAAEEVTHG
jgi:ParB/RepB/Spo0J family partition protein